MFRHRKIIALVCVAAMVFAAFAPFSPGLLWAVLVPLGLLFGAVASAPLRRPADPHLPSFTFTVSVPSRAPPAVQP